MEVPERIELDISAMEIGDSLRVADLPPQEGVVILDDPEVVLAAVIQPRVEEEPETVPAEGEELLEGEEGEEGEGVEGEEGEAGEGQPEAGGDESSSDE